MADTVTTSYLTAGSNKYKSYIALLSQTGEASDSVTATVLENTIDRNNPIVWTREGVGKYTGTLSGVFTSGRTFIVINQRKQNQFITVEQLDTETVQIMTSDSGLMSDDILYDTSIEIRVYS